MPDNIEKSGSTNAKTHKKSTSGKVFLLIIVLIIAGVYFSANNYQLILTYIGAKDKTATLSPAELEEKSAPADRSPESKSDTDSEPDSDRAELIQKEEPTSDLPSADPSSTSVISVGTTLEELKRYLASDQEVQEEGAQASNPAAKKAPEIEIRAETRAEITAARLGKYRTFLANANDLIIGFLGVEDYSLQLKNFESASAYQMPAEITEIVQMMREHLHLMNNSSRPLQIFPVQWKALEKFVKITKNSEDSQQLDQLQNQITQKLKIFTSWLYSENLQEQFLKNHTDW